MVAGALLVGDVDSEAQYLRLESPPPAHQYLPRPKDILRSFAHEMYHHHQDLQGLLDDSSERGTVEDPKYAQNDKRMRKLEMDAYMYGNILFRDYTDSLKYPNKQIT